jgi:hypothetical protein
MFWMSSMDLKKGLPWINSSKITPREKTIDLLVDDAPARTSGERYIPSVLLLLLTI